MTTAESSWKTELAVQCMLVQKVGDKDAFVVIGLAPPMLRMRRSTSQVIGHHMFWSMCKPDADTPKYEPILDFGNWKVMDSHWCAPAHLLVANDSHAFDGIPNTFSYTSVDAVWEPFLVHCANHGFYRLPENGVDRFLFREYGKEVEGDLYDKLVAAIRQALGCSEEDAARRIEHRLEYLESFECVCDDVLESEEFMATVDGDDDGEEARKYCNRARPLRKTRKIYRKKCLPQTKKQGRRKRMRRLSFHQ